MGKPRAKTNRSAAKRFRKTAKGYKHRRAFRNHLLTAKAPKRRRRLRRADRLDIIQAWTLKRLLPFK